MKRKKKETLKCLKCGRRMPTDWYPRFCPIQICLICDGKFPEIRKKYEEQL